MNKANLDLQEQVPECQKCKNVTKETALVTQIYFTKTHKHLIHVLFNLHIRVTIHVVIAYNKNIQNLHA